MANKRTHLGVSLGTVERLDAMRRGIMQSFDVGGPVPCEPTEPEKRAGRPWITYDALINALLDQRERRKQRRRKHKRKRGAARPQLGEQLPLPGGPQ